MPKYYASLQAKPEGVHEVHREGCTHLPAPEYRLYLGMFNTCERAIGEAKKTYDRVNGCSLCAKDCFSS